MGIREVKNRVFHTKNPILFNIRQWLLGLSFVENIAFHANMSDYDYIKMKYKERFGVEPDLDNPKNFNEKNNWRKLYDRKEIYTSMVDKYRVKEIINERAGEQYAFPIIGVWNRPEEIDWNALPNKFVLKCNHAGGVLVCRDKTKFDTKNAIKILRKTQRVNYFIRSREWPYKDVEKKIVAEQYMGENLIDYKNYCFNGELKYTLVWQNHSKIDGQKPEAHFCGAYDRDWVRTDMEIDYPSDDVMIEKPDGYDEMVMVAEKMSENIPFVRVDCYLIDGKPYVGEMTFFPWGGFQKFKDEKWNDYLGSLEELPKP